MQIEQSSLNTIDACYALTSTIYEEYLENFYNGLINILNENHATYTLVIGDFKAKLDKKKEESGKGNHRFDERNEHETMLFNFIIFNQILAMNSFFQKKKQKK